MRDSIATQPTQTLFVFFFLIFHLYYSRSGDDVMLGEPNANETRAQFK